MRRHSFLALALPCALFLASPIASQTRSDAPLPRRFPIDLPQEGGPPWVFPPAGRDVVWHVLRVELDVGANGSVEETLVFNGRMQLLRGDPFVNGSGRRQIDFVVEQWRATAWSAVLGDSVHYALSTDTTQAPSQITAETTRTDFPCTFTFNVIFDAYLGAIPVYRRHHGRPHGPHFGSVPPRGDPKTSPTITQFETTQIVVTHPTLGPIRFKPKDCNDQQSVTLGGGGGGGGEGERFEMGIRLHPSPVRAAATVSFSTARSGRVTGEVFDFSGRRLRRIDFGELPSGDHDLSWEATDRNGRPLPNGIYILRLSARGRAAAVTRFVVQR